MSRFPRSCARRVLWPSGFPLGSVLGSIDSAGTEVPLFADFSATMTESDFSMPCIIGYGVPSFPLRSRYDRGMAWRPPTSRCSAYVRMCLGS